MLILVCANMRVNGSESVRAYNISMHMGGFVIVRYFLLAALIVVLSTGVGWSQEITFWTWAGGAGYERANQILDPFREANPDVTLSLETRNVRHGEALLVAVASGVAPDLVTTHQDYHRDFANQGVFLDLRPYIERDGFDLSIFPEEVMRFYTGPNGEITGFPWQFTTILLGYNRELFERHGVSQPTPDWYLDDMVDAARTLTTDRNGDGEIDQWGLHTGVLRQYVWRLWGVNFMSEDGRRSNLGEPRSIEAFEWLADLHLVHGVVGSQGGGGDMPRWVHGQIGMNLNWPHYLTSAGHIMTDEWDIELIPTGPIGHKVARGATAGWAIPVTAPNPDKAWEVLKFLSSFETQLQLLALGDGGVSLPALNEHWIRLSPGELNFANPEAMQNKAKMALAYEYASIDRYPPDYSNIWRSVVNPAISQILSGEVAAQAILPEIARQVDAIVAETAANPEGE